MMRGVFLAVGLLIALTLGDSPTSPVSQPPDTGNARVEAVGTPSCSARSCHGGDEPLPGDSIGQHEYTKWNFSDPHTQAYQALTERSEGIIASLGWKEPACKQPRCLACHALSGREHGVPNLGPVGCESCHGKASIWLNPHTLGRENDWRKKYPEAAKSFVDVKDLAEVARQCVGCHIGSPKSDYPGVPRDMNHDMIAAGHPPLRFEFAGYFAQLP